MRLPHKVRIRGNVWYRVVWVDRFDNPDQRGECWYEARTISILRGMSPKLSLETFFHELHHAIEWEWKCTIPHKAIEVLEQAMPRILEMNGWLPREMKPRRKKATV